jgi:hypothetical protein
MGAVNSWVRSDVYEAAAWVDSLPAGTDRDMAAPEPFQFPLDVAARNGMDLGDEHRQ